MENVKVCVRYYLKVNILYNDYLCIKFLIIFLISICIGSYKFVLYLYLMFVFKIMNLDYILKYLFEV